MASKLRTTHHRKRAAFTVIELLAVIAILTLLLAVLAPALQRAEYVAGLAVCSSNLHQIATGVDTYAANNRSRYPSRLGVPWSWKSNHLAGPGAGDDPDLFNPSGVWAHGTHPDSDGVMWNEALDSEAVENVAGSTKFTLSRWISYQTNQRGLIDRNFVHMDGAVTRIWDVVINDPRMVALPEFAGGGFHWARCQLPPAD